MNNNKENIEILNDKALVENLISKQVLNNYEANQFEVPANYFQQFETQVLSKVGKENKAKKSSFFIPKWGQIAVAASFFTIIATTYLWLQSNDHEQTVASNISIQEITTTEIDAYVNENEAIAEIDWQAEINKETSNLENINARLIKDTNNTQ